MTHKIHDKGYKRLFSNKRFFQQLMESFVTLDWVEHIDFSDCETLDKSFISEHYKQTESDLIYKVKYKGKESYICVLIEFQSTVQWHTALRVLNYITNFWMDYVTSDAKIRSLPPVFPIVLYNGEDEWNAVQNISGLIDNVELLDTYAPQFQYFKIDENDYNVEQLLSIHNLVSTLFLSEAHYDLELIKNELLALFDTEPDKHAISLLLNWFKQLAVNNRLDEMDYDALEYVYKSKDEARSMIETAVERERQRFYQNGWDKGKTEGIELGKTEGEANNQRKVTEAMLRTGQVTIEFISGVTGLSIEEIEAIQRDMPKH